MRKIIVFNQVSLDGYFTGANGDLSWAHKTPGDTEWNDFVSGNAGGDGTLLFGRITYEMMVSYWPTPMAAKNAAKVAEAMNDSGDDLVTLGSGTIVSQLAQQNLIDTYQIVVNPIVLGKGRTMFEGLDGQLDLHQTESRTFGNGNTLLTYEPVR